jgi:transcription termination factor Rho
MTVLHRDALEASPLADLHAIASELGIDGFRRLRKAELIDRILRDSDADAGDNGGSDDNGGSVAEEVVDEAAADEDARPKRRRGSRGGRGRSRDDADRDDRDADESEDAPERRDETIEGVVELLGNGSGFVRVSPPEPSDGDVYISPPRCAAASSSRATASRARCASRGARSATRRSCASTPSTARRPRRSPRARPTTSCPARSRRCAWSSAPTTPR